MCVNVILHNTDLIKLAIKATYTSLLIFQLHYLLPNISILEVHYGSLLQRFM